MTEPIPPSLAAKLKLLPASIRRVLKAACDGEWSRVTIADDGSWTVHNRPQYLPAEQASAQARKRPARRKPAAAAPKPPARKMRTVSPQELATMAGVAPPPAPPSELRVVLNEEPRARPADEHTLSPAPAPELVASFDWASVDLELMSGRLRDKCAKGLPAAIRYSYSPDVLAMYGVDFELLDACLRQPERVEIRPESFNKEKGYTILGFFRGDLNVILGMRMPATPRVIAVYVTSLLEHDVHRVNHTGSGGARNGHKGLPRTPKQVVQRLRAHGAEVLLDLTTESKVTEVRYHGELLGKISTGTVVDRATCESDYQRMLRRMHSLDQREGSAVNAR